jgi:hypothetical protein
MTQCPSDWPSDAEIEAAYVHLARVIAGGADPQLGADGLIHVTGSILKAELAWAHEHREAFKSALVGSGRYAHGTLDRIYGIGQDGGQ